MSVQSCSLLDVVLKDISHMSLSQTFSNRICDTYPCFIRWGKSVHERISHIHGEGHIAGRRELM